MLIPENKGDRVLSVFKTKIPTEYREKRFKVFQELNISNVSIFITDCQSYTFHLMNIKFQAFSFNHNCIIVQGRSLLRNSTLVTSHLTVLQRYNFTIDVLLRIF